MTDHSFFQLKRTVVTKDERLLEGIFDVWFLDDGLYFLHYFSFKKEFYDNVREQKWGLKPAERLKDNAGSFFVSRGEITGRSAHPLHVKEVSAQTGIKVWSFDTHVLVLKTAEGGTLKLTCDGIKDHLGDLEVYFSGGSVFNAEEYAGHGLNIPFLAPIALVSRLAEKNVDPALSDGTLEEIAANRDYMDRFWKLFAVKIQGKQDREVLEYMMDRFPEKFREEILEHCRKISGPKFLMFMAATALLGIAALGSIFVLKPSFLKLFAGIVGLFLLMVGVFGVIAARRLAGIHAALIRKYR
jgi:hypothetical protein